MVLYVILPCFNEEQVIPTSAEILKEKFESLVKSGVIENNSKIVFVDDGSKDRTWDIICELHDCDKMYEGLKLSHNRGHQVALIAGMEYASKKADAVITMDVDLQQDVNAIGEFVRMYGEGYDVICGIRKNRDTDLFMKKMTASIYYKFMRLLGCEIYENSADYRLLSKKALEAIVEYKESDLFLRGIVPTLGFKSGVVYFDVRDRMQGESKYNLKKMFVLAFDGIASFTVKPIRFFLVSGMIISSFSMVVIIYIIFGWFTSKTVPGWASLAAAIWFIGGVELLGIGVVGEYVGRTYIESKKRPRYFIEDKAVDETSTEGGQS